MPTKLGSNNPFPSVLLGEQGSTPTTPAAGYQRLYPKTDGSFYAVDDAGNERNLEEIQMARSSAPTLVTDLQWCLQYDSGTGALQIVIRIGGVDKVLDFLTVT